MTILPLDTFKQLLQEKKIRGAGLYEIGRKPIFFADVKPGTYYHNRPFVKV